MQVPPARETGSILIEALVAVLILAAASGFWFNSIGGTVARQAGVTQRALAMLVASSQLATVGVVAPAATGTRSGRDGAYDWSISIEPAPEAEGLVRVNVTVRDARGGKLAQLSTLRPAT